MSHFSSFINAPFRADRGKRHLAEPVNYKPSILHERREAAAAAASAASASVDEGKQNSNSNSSGSSSSGHQYKTRAKAGQTIYDNKPWDFLKDERPEQDKKVRKRKR
jgi:hypothetical protein